MSELVDYSATANSDWAGLAAALKAQGKVGVGRYAVNDLSPNGRGIGPDEYAAMTTAGLETFLYWESSEGWMLNGEAAGMSAAVNAQANITRAGMPHDIPVYFACDFDAAESDQDQIDDCLRGCAKVLGFDRVGIYGGFYVVERCFENGTASWFAQTSAWSGGQWFEGNHLEQYAYNHIIHGTYCDDVRALQLTYGQASKFTHPVPHYATPAPITWKRGDTGVHDLNGTPALAFLLEVKCSSTTGAIPVQSSAASAKPTGPKIAPNETRVAVGSYRGGPHRNAYLVLQDGSRVIRSKFRPLAPLPAAS
jgi:hypothetical protein